MPLYYSTNSPKSDDKNSITRSATDFGIRDFLLLKNIQNPIRYPQLPTSINGAPRGGEPFLDTMVGDGSVRQTPYLTDIGQFYHDGDIILNQYKNDDGFEYIDVPTYLNRTQNPNFVNSTAPNDGPYSNIYRSEDQMKKYGLLAKTNDASFRKKNTIKNLYLDSTKQIDIADYITLSPIDATSQINGYLDEYGYLNFGGGDRNNLNVGQTSVGTSIANVIGSVLNGQGVGINNIANPIGSLVSNFDLRASLAGRALSASGSFKDTKLGSIGAQQLALSLANNASFNAQQLILGKLNLKQNINALFGAGDFEFPRPNYKITVSDNILGAVSNTFERVLGFNVPKSELDSGGSIFSTENGYVDNITRSNEMLDNTGKGQRNALARQFKANLLGISQYDNPSNSPFRSGYSPNFQKGDNGFIVKGQKPKLYAFYKDDGFVYDFIKGVTEDSPISELSYKRDKLLKDYGFTDTGDGYNGGSTVRQLKASWTSLSAGTVNTVTDTNGNTVNEQINANRKTLLGKTQLLFNNVGMKNIVSAKGDMNIDSGSQIQTSVVKGGISKGSAVLSNNYFDIDGNLISPQSPTADNTFCRSWTTYDRYDKVVKLIRNNALNKTSDVNNPNDPSSDKDIIKNDTGWRYNTVGSVLDDNGFVKITPYKGLKEDNKSPENVKKYMFSIENLAWSEHAYQLIDSEKGPGDLLTGKKGRIMWFPPYDISFSESSSVQNESTNFIGRGEPIYTYNNTERTGNLSFKLVVDHPSIINSFNADGNAPSDEFIRSWWAGCTSLDSKWGDKLTKLEKEKFKDVATVQMGKNTIKKADVPSPIKIYFLNDVTEIREDYENGDNLGIGAYVGIDKVKCKTCQPVKGRLFRDRTDFGLNVGNNQSASDSVKIPGYPVEIYAGWLDETYQQHLRQYLKDKCPKCRAICVGFASNQGDDYSNKFLAEARAKSAQQWLIKNNILPSERITVELSNSVEKNNGQYNADTDSDSLGPKKDRYATIRFINDDVDIDIPIITGAKNEKVLINASDTFKNRFYNEANFFEKLKREDEFVFDKFSKQIRYFHPAFHSTTPEGFNSRLTFLLQCTRQGRSNYDDNPKNLAFGPQPVCILRIGDFYNTKIYIDNVQLDFEPLVWDLNPEGIGVQPMIANVTISFKYIGGSTLLGPINKLQNALSFNFFANTQVYDRRADTIIEASDKTKKSKFELKPGKQQINPQVIVESPVPVDGVDKKQEIESEYTNSTPNTTPPISNDIDNLKITNLTSTPANYLSGSTVSFTIETINGQNLSKEYPVIVNISNTQAYESFEYKNLSNFTGTSQNYSFLVSDLTPTCSGLTVGQTYNFNVIVGDRGTLTSPITIGTTTVTTSSIVPEFEDKVISFELSTLYENKNSFSENVTNAVTTFSSNINDFLKNYEGIGVTDVRIQTKYNSTDYNITTKIDYFLSKTYNNVSYKNFDVRGVTSFKGLEDQISNVTNMKNEMEKKHNDIMNSKKSLNIAKVGDKKYTSIMVEWTNFYWNGCFYQWTD
jgi:hypothetical protein